MKGNLTWQLIISVAVLFVSLIYITPSINPELPDWWKRFLPDKKVSLGLDLKGGIHMILETETQKAIEAHMDGILEELRREAKAEKIKIVEIKKSGFDRIEAGFKEEAEKNRFQEIVSKKFSDLNSSPKKEQDRYILELTLSAQALNHLKELTVEQALETIRNRIDQFGVAEPEIRRQEEGRILVQLPGIQDIERAKEIIGKTALLEFKLVDEEHSLEEALKGNIPPGSQILYHVSKDPKTGQVTKVPYLLKKKALLTGSRIVDAKVQINQQYNEPYVTLTFDSVGARLFERITEENVHKRLAIILDGNVYSAPVIQEKISGGRAQITGRFTMEEAKDLAIVLRAGALPAPVKIIEERSVGPSLGKDSIEAGIKATIFAGIAVAVFMLIYYSLSGLIADLMLIFDLLLIFAGLAFFGATLTLPGIAGIALTLGMAVDANVLIYERIREELRNGKTPMAAIDGGFGRATITILDANITTLIVALVLFQFGSGPIRGFAVTLSLGIIASVFTAVFVSKMLFKYLYGVVGLKRISI